MPTSVMERLFFLLLINHRFGQEIVRKEKKVIGTF